MRKVKFNSYCMSRQKLLSGEAYFHQWIFSNGILHAILELDDGKIMTVKPNELQFLEPPEKPLVHADSKQTADVPF